MKNKQVYISILVGLLYLITPSILIRLANSYSPPFNSSLYLIFIYVITLIGIIIFFRFKYHINMFWVLLLGIAISPLYTLIIEYIDSLDLPNYLQDFGFHFVIPLLALFFYVVPFIFLSVIIFIILEIKKRS